MLRGSFQDSNGKVLSCVNQLSFLPSLRRVLPTGEVGGGREKGVKQPPQYVALLPLQISLNQFSLLSSIHFFQFWS